MSGIEKLQGLRQKFEAKNKERPLYLQAMVCSAGQLFFRVWGWGVVGGFPALRQSSEHGMKFTRHDIRDSFP